MKRALFAAIVALIGCPVIAQVSIPELQVAQAEEWEPFRTCLAENVAVVEQVIPSIAEGADFLVELRCANEAGALQSGMSRRLYESSGETEYSEDVYAEMAPLFDMIPFNVRAAARVWLFEARKRRLGL